MKKSRFTNEQIAFGLRQVESGTPIEAEAWDQSADVLSMEEEVCGDGC